MTEAFCSQLNPQMKLVTECICLAYAWSKAGDTDLLAERHKAITDKILEIANRLRGPYRPPQYRLVMLPLVVLRRLDCVLEPTKDAVLAEHKRLIAAHTAENAIPRLLTKVVNKGRKQPLYNTSPFTFAKLLGDSENIAPNLVAYINGYSETAREIFAKFKFSEQIEKLDASNRLFNIIKSMSEVDLHPDMISNLEMGYVFEHLVMKFNEQANEEAGDHFTPREVIRLMTQLVYTGEEDVYRQGVYREIYDPACGTGGMLSVSEETIRAGNKAALLGLYGQEYNDESWAICCSDMLIKDEETGNIVLGDTLGDGKTMDGFQGKKFHYMLANPPFGVEWKDQQKAVTAEHDKSGFAGRFGAGLPAINDGSLLFLQHMVSKMHSFEAGNDEKPGSKIAIVFNGSPLFSGDAGSGPSNIRRWIIENDWLDAIVAMPDQLFYNTGIFTYVWLVTNRKASERKGKVQLIDGTKFFDKMKKSLNNKRNELTDEHIRDLVKFYGNFTDGERADMEFDGAKETRTVSRIFDNREFGFLKVTVERPLRMNFEATAERIAKLDEQSAFIALAQSKKRKDAKTVATEEEEGRKQQEAIKTMLATLEPKGRYMDREVFDADVEAASKKVNLKLDNAIWKTIYAALGERDQEAKRCIKKKSDPAHVNADQLAGKFALGTGKDAEIVEYEPDSELRDTENIPLPMGCALPLPMSFGPDAPNDELVKAMRPTIDGYMQAEVLPHVGDAWVDYLKTKVGYEIPINRHFYVYKAPRPLTEIEKDIATLEGEIAGLLKGLVR